MRLRQLIELLEEREESKGNVMLMEFKIILPEEGGFIEELSSCLNSVRDSSKKMSVKEYVKLNNEGHWGDL